MCRLIDDITTFLESNGFECSRLIRDDFDVICTRTLDGRSSKVIIPLEITADTQEEAAQVSENEYECIQFITSREGHPLIITEDRWNSRKEMMQKRILSHLEVFSQAYARNCEVRRIDKAEAQEFLNANHSYGYAACRYRYGLFLKRHTGHIAEEIRNLKGDKSEDIGMLVAVATFSNARKWNKGDKEIRSYEWTRYASLPQMRISGGMGKMLKTFIEEVQPDDIMSYADLEWSAGKVYKQLGFKKEDGKAPVMFCVDKETWTRTPVRPGITKGSTIAGSTDQSAESLKLMQKNLFFRNFGSNKYRLKLTEYE